MDKDIDARLRSFMENEAKSCSMDLGCVTPEYIFRMWGGEIPVEEIKAALDKVKNDMVL